MKIKSCFKYYIWYLIFDILYLDCLLLFTGSRARPFLSATRIALGNFFHDSLVAIAVRLAVNYIRTSRAPSIRRCRRLRLRNILVYAPKSFLSSLSSVSKFISRPQEHKLGCENKHKRPKKVNGSVVLWSKPRSRKLTKIQFILSLEIYLVFKKNSAISPNNIIFNFTPTAWCDYNSSTNRWLYVYTWQSKS